MTISVVTTSFNSTSAGPSRSFSGDFNVTVWGTFDATVVLQRSFDGETWHNVARDSTGATASFTAPISLIASEPEIGVFYRASCTAYASGTVNVRISQ